MILRTMALTKYFQIGKNKLLHAVDKVSLDISANEILGLVGESGSGKSTFGKTILGIHSKTSGKIYFKGAELPDKFTSKDYMHYSKLMQMIFQDPYSSLNPRMTVREIVGEGLALSQKISRKELDEKVAFWLRRVGLVPDHMSRYPHEFSGGQRQRIGIARALIVEPEFVVCDEPISALDVSIQAQIINLLEELKSDLGLTLLFIAHDLSMVRFISDRMAVMYLGALVELGPSDEVYFKPQHPYTQMLVASNPEPDPMKEKQKPRGLIKGEIPSPVNIKPGCRFAGRCPHVTEKCTQENPEWKNIGSQHWVACHLF